MKFIMRHAQTDDGWPDKSRRLSPTGAAQARTVGEWLVGKGVERITSSGATRAMETAQIIGQVLNITPTVREDLYAAPAQRLVDSAEDGLLLVGHNPACEDSYEVMTGKWGPRFEPGTVAGFGPKGKIELFTP